MFNKNTKIMVNLLEECDKDNCDLNGFITYCALDSICGKKIKRLYITCINNSF